jgi:hypothetical protein
LQGDKVEVEVEVLEYNVYVGRKKEKTTEIQREIKESTNKIK